MLKHRRRRERAERRLAATAENLERLGDLVREVRRQIRPLERQAAAARSHDAVASELLAVRRYLAGAELAELAARRRAAAQGLTICHEEERELARRPRGARCRGVDAPRPSCPRAARRTWPARWAASRAWSSGPGARPACSASAGRVVAAALDAAADVDVVSTLEAEAARLAPRWPPPTPRPTSPVRAERAELAAALAALDDEEAGCAERWAGRARRRPPGRGARHGAGPHRAGGAGRGARAAGHRGAGRRGWPRSSSATPRRRCGPICCRPPPPTSRRDDGRARGRRRRAHGRARAGGRSRRGGAARRPTRPSRRATAARPGPRRSSAPSRDLQGAGGRELLRGVDGVVGSLLDLVEIDDGWEAAFEAAAGAGVAAVVVDGRRSAQQALATLRERGVTGAVLAPRTRPPRLRPRHLPAGQQRPAAAPPRAGPPRRSRRRVGARRARSGAPCGSTAGRRPSTSRSSATTWSS